MALVLAGTVLGACGAGATAPPPTDQFAALNSNVAGTKGQPVTAPDDMIMTLVDAQCSDADPSQPGYVWVGFELTVHNPDPVPYTEPLDGFGAWTDDRWAGEQFDGTSIGNGMAPAAWQPIVVTYTLDPGAAETGWLVWTLPKPQRHVTLGYKVSAWSTVTRVHWDVTC